MSLCESVPGVAQQGATPSAVLSALRSAWWRQLALEGPCWDLSQESWPNGCLIRHMLHCMSTGAQTSANLVGFNPFLEKMPVNEGSQLQDCEIELKWKQPTAVNRSSQQNCIWLMFERLPESGYAQVSALAHWVSLEMQLSDCGNSTFHALPIL